MSELPQGWIETKLEKIIDILDSQRIPLNNLERAKLIDGIPENQLVPYFGATGQVGYVNTHLFDEPLILLGEDGVPFFDLFKRKAYRVTGKSWVNNHAHVLREKSGFTNGRYIEAFLNSFNYTDYVSGTTRLKLTQASMREIPIPLAPLNEQNRIADKLDTLLTAVDSCRARLDKVPMLIKRFRQSVLAAATSGALTEDWHEEHGLPPTTVTTLGEILKVSSGKFLPAKKMTPNGSIPVYGGNGVNGYHDESNVSEETLVIGRVGFYCGCVHLTPELAWITDNALIVRHDPSVTSRRFLFFALRGMNLRTNDSSTAQPVISGQKIYSLPISIPGLAEQHEIIRRVENMFAIADKLEASLATTRKRVEQLTPAILAQAFRGELVPQDPNDEPASALLARIAATAAPKRAVKKAA